MIKVRNHILLHPLLYAECDGGMSTLLNKINLMPFGEHHYQDEGWKYGRTLIGPTRPLALRPPVYLFGERPVRPVPATNILPQDLGY